MTAQKHLSGSPDATLTANSVPASLSGRGEVAHTPGPWVYSPCEALHDDDVMTFAVWGDGHAVCEIQSPADVAEANAARIVACVNYCEGYAKLPDTSLRDLEASYLSGVENLHRVIDAANAQRDALADALRRVALLPREDRGWASVPPGLLREIDAALAQLEQGQ